MVQSARQTIFEINLGAVVAFEALYSIESVASVKKEMTLFIMF